MKHAGFMVYLLYIDVNLFGAFDYETNKIYFLNPVYFEKGSEFYKQMF